MNRLLLNKLMECFQFKTGRFSHYKQTVTLFFAVLHKPYFNKLTAYSSLLFALS